MSGAIDITGTRFGRWTVVRREGKKPNGQALWRCRCDCGRENLITGSGLRTGDSTNCGCLRNEKNSARMKITERTHGHATVALHSVSGRTYDTWRAMRQRCLNPRNVRYPRYGGRGITICERWMKFENFLADMGPRPSPKHSIDRINTDGNYEPSNCRWATPKEQTDNRKRTVMITYNGMTMSMLDWSLRLGGKRTLVISRIRSGWDPQLAVSHPRWW